MGLNHRNRHQPQKCKIKNKKKSQIRNCQKFCVCVCVCVRVGVCVCVPEHCGQKNTTINDKKSHQFSTLQNCPYILDGGNFCPFDFCTPIYSFLHVLFLWTMKVYALKVLASMKNRQSGGSLLVLVRQARLFVVRFLKKIWTFVYLTNTRCLN